MYLAYKYIRDKRRKAKAARDAEQSGLPPQTQATPDSPTVHDGSQSAAPAHSGRISTSTKWKIMLMTALAVPVFFETLDYTVVATAQVQIASVFNRLDLQSYIGTVYLLTSTVFLPLFASVADVWGRQFALQLSLLFFMVGSAISTGSQNMPTMLAGRGIAGIGAAGMMAVIRIIMSDSSSLDDNNWQQSMLFLLYSAGYCVGPVIGGALITVSFRWIFAINLPCALLAMILSFILLRGRTKGAQPRRSALPSTSTSTSPVHETFGEKMLRIDWVGAFLFTGAGITLLLALNWGSSAEWSTARVIACFVVSGVLWLVWGAWEYFLEREAAAPATNTNLKRHPLMRTEPMIPLQMFVSWDLCIAQFAIFVSGMVMIVMFYFVAIFFTIVSGLSGTEAGTQLLYFAPGMGAGALISIWVVRITRQPKPPILAGSLIMTVALGLVSYAMDINRKSYINGFLVMSGVGVGLSIGPLVIHTRFSQPENRIAIVSALTLFSRSLGGTVGLAQCGAVLNAKVNSGIAALVSSGTLSPADAGQLAKGLAAGLTSVESIAALPPGVQALVRDTFQQGSRWSFISLVPWAGAAFVASLFLSNIRDSDREAREAAGRKGAGGEEREREKEKEKRSEGEAAVPALGKSEDASERRDVDEH